MWCVRERVREQEERKWTDAHAWQRARAAAVCRDMLGPCNKVHILGEAIDFWFIVLAKLKQASVSPGIRTQC